MKLRQLNPFYWLMRFIQINRDVAAAIPPITEDDLESMRKFSEHLNRLTSVNKRPLPARDHPGRSLRLGS